MKEKYCQQNFVKQNRNIYNKTIIRDDLYQKYQHDDSQPSHQSCNFIIALASLITLGMHTILGTFLTSVPPSIKLTTIKRPISQLQLAIVKIKASEAIRWAQQGPIQYWQHTNNLHTFGANLSLLLLFIHSMESRSTDSGPSQSLLMTTVLGLSISWTLQMGISWLLLHTQVLILLTLIVEICYSQTMAPFSLGIALHSSNYFLPLPPQRNILEVMQLWVSKQTQHKATFMYFHGQLEAARSRY
ncbi:hypothetical protein FGO68_gene15325 [Halteria grandinella]|uniref:Uncharacterized protein n=1 Tax=Halteria grandinella TaxID=5974 RepID=A0A8J8NER4_HALGN|nr:hypothetical protein FGO68_gene15325 [Halteria grandinella]